MFSLTKNLIEAYEGKYFSKKFIRNGFLCIQEKMLSPGFKGAFFFFLTLVCGQQGGFVLFSGKDLKPQQIQAARVIIK